MIGSSARYRVYVCYGANCPARGAAAIYAALEQQIAAHGLGDSVALRPGNCNKLCRLGPSMVVYPGPIRYGELTTAAVAEIVAQHLTGGQPVTRWQRTGDWSLP